MRLIKLVTHEFIHESRDERELQVAHGLGFETIVMAKGDQPHREDRPYYQLHLHGTRPLGTRIHPNINRFVSIFTWARTLKRYRADVISCHDLTALFIGWLSTRYTRKKHRPLLVYDSHEFELGRNTEGKRSVRMQKFIARLEKFLIKRSVFSIMVNDSIADEVTEIHQLEQRPIVVRNVPPYWHLDEEVITAQRQAFIEALAMPKETFLMMYHGHVFKGRGVETLMAVTKENPQVALIILGNGEASYMEELKSLSETYGIEKRVLYHPAVPVESLWRYVGAADVGMVLVPAVSKSYYYMSPNKFFENIQAQTPIICSHFPEVTKIIEAYQIGLTVDPEDIKAIGETVERLRLDSTLYEQMKTNLMAAKKVLCWEQEQHVLKDAYLKVFK